MLVTIGERARILVSRDQDKALLFHRPRSHHDRSRLARMDERERLKDRDQPGVKDDIRLVVERTEHWSKKRPTEPKLIGEGGLDDRAALLEITPQEKELCSPQLLSEEC